ncbi:ABC transporter permease [Paenibacillus sp. FA6]|uniref:ABC transporter permease n=1 Tax=Paenibacillus sp. FA6 TaxID=3413029 RepID=UPI003F655138
MNSLTIAWNMIKRVIGTRKGILVYIVLPCIVVSLTVALLGGTSGSKVIIPYSNQDSGPAGQHVIEELSRNSDYVLELKESEGEVRDIILGKKGTLGLSIPAGFTEQILLGQEPQIAMIELTTSEATYMIKMSLNRLVGGMVQTAGMIGSMDPAAEVAASVDAAVEVASSTELGGGASLDVFAKSLEEISQHRIQSEKTDYQLYANPWLNNVTGFTLMFMMGLVTSTVKMIMDDRRSRTIARIFSAPVRSYEISIGHMLGSLFVGFIQIVVILILSRWVLQVDYGIPFFMHLLILGSFLLVAMGIASAVAGLVRNPNNAGMLNSIIITPTCMLGGCFWPLSIMPDYLQKAANFIPQKWAIEAVNRIASGGHLIDIWLPLSILGLMAIILLAIGSVIFRPSDTGVNA